MVADLGPLLEQRQALHVAVNLAATDLHHARILEVTREALAGTRIAPRQIAFEATERCFINADAARDIIAQLRAAGHAVSIDDFGTGYSSLSYLQSYRIDALKIDKSFVDAIGADAATSGVIDHVIAMAKALGLKIVAEGVETEAQARYLRERSVDYAQGWLFSKPLAGEAFVGFIENRPVGP